MRLTLKLPYLQAHKGGYRYRRKYPQDVSRILGKTWHLAPLGPTVLVAAENWKRVNAAYERQVQEVRSHSASKSPFQTYTEGVKLIREMGFNTQAVLAPTEGDHLEPPPHEDLARSQAAYEIMERYPTDQRTGYPVGMSGVHDFVVRALLDKAPPKPSPKFSDAVTMYKEEKISGNALDVRKKGQRVDRLAAAFKTVVKADPEITQVDREDAKRFRDHLLAKGTLKPTSVRRELNVMKAVFNHAIKENGLSSYLNPFNSLPIPGLDVVAEIEERDPLPLDVLKRTRERLMSNAKTELQLIWRLLEGTGCRLAEITGLRSDDVVITGDTPHVVVTWHEDRRVKTKASRREVPLVGDALEAARQALKLVGRRTMLFEDYGNDSGPGNASSALMRHMRLETDNPKHVIHSLRHNMADWLLLSGAEENAKNMILGHSLKGTGAKTYGGSEARRRVLTEAMKKAHEVRGF